MVNAAKGKAAATALKGGILLGGLMGLGAVAQAQTAPAADDSLTWHGVTLYGIVDIGVQDDTHGAPISDTSRPAATTSSSRTAAIP